MKKYSITSIWVIALVMISSCEDYLDRTPESVISEETAFRNFENFQGFTEELYRCIPDKFHSHNQATGNFGDDEIWSDDSPDQVGFRFDRGDFWAWTHWSSYFDHGSLTTTQDRTAKGLWPLAWYGIRKANLGLENLHRMTEATQEERELIEGQLLFFRGWLHFNMAQYWGSLPYIDRVLPGDEPLREEKLSYQEFAEKAHNDFRRAADLLPINWDNTATGRRTAGNNHYRINKIMALSYLGKNLLWASSPLMNSVSGGGPVYNADLARRSAEAFGELLNLVESGQTQYALEPFSNYKRIFLTRGQNWLLPGGAETIFRTLVHGVNATHWNLTQCWIPAVIARDANHRLSPTSNYVNRNYGMANGLPLPEDISQADPESGYDPNYPFRNRDPRFYHDIAYDGVQMVLGSLSPENANLRYANLYTGGNFRNDRNSTRTGYVHMKFMMVGYNNFDQLFSYGNAGSRNIPYVRLSDIYLMYAEAALMGYNSVTGQSPNFSKNAVEAVNTIRERAGMPEVLPRFQTTVSVFLEELRRERAVELAFEGHRFTDLRRWMLITHPDYAAKTAMEFDRAEALNTEVPSDTRIVNLRERVIINRNYDDKHYWLPFKVSDVSLYPEFDQNPGW
ncbi:RagB/SusD family nutrient uptake outer membrane protein [Belliella marina]|uniref:RagB/SusD family nutrient uptake outer membrane protein n=2 Tax=Belliella marina TaxID=1644146 RepID=A0ABW4VPL2_9BACT